MFSPYQAQKTKKVKMRILQDDGLYCIEHNLMLFFLNYGDTVIVPCSYDYIKGRGRLINIELSSEKTKNIQILSDFIRPLTDGSYANISDFVKQRRA